ncbi:MAG: IclR family transcriptional regulator [Actinomycetota bacterium]
MQAIDRAFTVLRAVASRRGTSTLADVTRESGLPKSTVLRLLIALEDQGAVQTVGGRYAIGPGLASLSHQGAPASALKEIARPHIVELAELLQEHVSLTIADGDATLYVDTAIAESSVMVQDWTGERLPYHASAGGLALMAAWPDAAIRAHVATGLEQSTPSTVISLKGIRLKVAQARAGAVWTHQEFAEDVNGVGALIVDPDGEPLGALNAYGPDYRFPGDRDLDEIGQAVIETSRAIGDRIGVA